MSPRAFECTTFKDAGLTMCVLKILVQVTWLSTFRMQSLREVGSCPFILEWLRKMVMGFNDEYHQLIFQTHSCFPQSNAYKGQGNCPYLPPAFESKPSSLYLWDLLNLSAAYLDLLIEAWGNPLTSQWRYGAWLHLEHT